MRALSVGSHGHGRWLPGSSRSRIGRAGSTTADGLLTHASRSVVRADCAEACDLIEQLSGQRPPAELPTGGIIGARTPTGCSEPVERGHG